MSEIDFTLVEELSKKAIKISENSFSEIERNCWMIVHEHIHGVMPSEYDIREIDENLYLKILERVKVLLSID